VHSARHGGRTTDTTKAGGAFDVDAVDSALLREVHRQQRESTPGSSPHRKRQRINGDRCVGLLTLTTSCRGMLTYVEC